MYVDSELTSKNITTSFYNKRSLGQFDNNSIQGDHPKEQTLDVFEL